MANTGNTQQQINYGASANDGQGDPLRTAFIKTDDNFDNVWLAGPVGSNITIGNNTIQSNNTNGNIILKPNGTGIVQANASIIPNADNTRDLGSSVQAWRRAYINELLPDSLTVSGDAVIGGNLTVQGDTIQIGNITTDTLTIQLANTAANATAATGAGITVGASDNIATILYNSTANRWNVSVGMSAVGNISAPYFSGNGSLLTGIVSSYGNANVVANLAALASNPVSTTGNVTAGNLLTGGGVSATGNISANYFLGNGSQLTGITSYGNSNVTSLLANLGSNTISTTGNITGNLVAAGANGQVLYNRDGLIGASPNNFSFDENTLTLYVKQGAFSGNATTGQDALYAGIPGATTLGNAVMVQITGNSAFYSQCNFQNISNAGQASGDFNVTADNGNDTTHFINLGITSSNWNGTQPNSLGNRLGPDDGYLFVQDGDLVMGTRVGSNSYVWKFDTTGNVTADGNLIPSANGVYSLGNSTNYWANVWLGNITTSNISVSGNITGGNISTGVITLTNGATIRDTSGDAVAFGQNAGLTSQGNFAVGIGRNAGQTTQGGAAVAIGVSAGDTSQGNSAVAVGQSAGFTNQSANTVAVGVGAGQTSQGVDAVAVGASAGSLTQGIAAVAIGTLAGRTFQANNSIIINATGANLDQTTANTFTVAPVRNDVANVAEVMFYNTTSKEITYGNVISVAGNITGGNILTGGLVSATGNVTGNYILGNGSQLTSINAVTVDITDTNGLTTVYYPTFVENRANAQIARADVDLTYRTDDNLLTVGNVSVTGNVTGGNILTGGLISATGNISGGNLSLSGNITSSIGFTGATITINNAPGGVEGAEIQWALPSPANTSLSGTFVQDVYANGMRFFESSGNTRGLYMDLGNAPNGSTTAVGYRDIPQVAFTANTTIATTDAGRHYYSTLSTGNVLTIANNASQGFQVGAAISIINQGTGNITVAQGSGVTLYLAGNATAGNRTISTFGMATIMKVATDTWFINGTGVA